MPLTGNPFEYNIEKTEFDIDEGDIIKVYNDYIFKLTNDGLHIIHTNNGIMMKTAFLPMDILILDREKDGISNLDIFFWGMIIYDILIHNNKLILINVRAEEYQTQDDGEEVTDYDVFTDVAIYDLTTLTPNRFDFEPQRQFTFQGAYRTAKIFNNKLYFVAHLIDWEATEIPYYIEDGQTYEMSDNTMLSPKGIAMFALIDLNEQEETKTMAVLGSIYELCFFHDAIYPVFSSGSTSIIVKLDIDTLAYIGQISDVGYSLKNRYFVHDDGTYLFIATSHGQSGSKLSVYNRGNLQFIAAIKDIAPNEDLKSVRFAQDYCYLVTFLERDPVYKIDISDPENPVIMDQLKIDGYSSYLHMVEDNSIAIGIGYTDSWSLQQKISLFDASGAAVREIKTIESYMMVYGHAPRDPRFVFIDRTRKLIVLTTVGLSYDDAKNYGEERIAESDFYHNLIIFEYSQNDLAIKKVISEKLNGRLFANVETFESYISARIVAIGDYMYFATNTKIVSYNLDSLKQVDELVL